MARRPLLVLVAALAVCLPACRVSVGSPSAARNASVLRKAISHTRDAHGATVTYTFDLADDGEAPETTVAVFPMDSKALDFLDELGTPSEVARKGDTFTFKSEATATATVVINGGYVRRVKILGKSPGYPASTSSWRIDKISG